MGRIEVQNGLRVCSGTVRKFWKKRERKSAGEVFADHSTYPHRSGCFSAEVRLTRKLSDAEV